jgi:hypothetical protein
MPQPLFENYLHTLCTKKRAPLIKYDEFYDEKYFSELTNILYLVSPYFAPSGLECFHS